MQEPQATAVKAKVERLEPLKGLGWGGKDDGLDRGIDPG